LRPTHFARRHARRSNSGQDCKLCISNDFETRPIAFAFAFDFDFHHIGHNPAQQCGNQHESKHCTHPA